MLQSLLSPKARPAHASTSLHQIPISRPAVAKWIKRRALQNSQIPSLDAPVKLTADDNPLSGDPVPNLAELHHM